MKYDHNAIEEKWQQFWAKNGTFEAKNDSEKLKYYVLDMFPYPSGAGLHVGHPLGYIASDIYARYKRHQGFNVLHPQGYDSFGLPAEQYAIQTGQHPAITTETNIARYREQLDKIGFSFDWSREVRTSDPAYYKWTQWIFIQLFESWYNIDSDKAEPINTLTAKFEMDGNASVNAACDDDVEDFSAEAWNSLSNTEKQEILLKYRLTYLAETEVNWCPALGTVLANDEIVNGVSERGGHPVVRKKMTQWSMRISAYAQRLLDGLQEIDWPQPLKDSQTNWIGRSVGASVSFNVLPPAPSMGGGADSGSTHDSVSKHKLESQSKVLPLGEDLGGDRISVFTTRPDTIFGVTFMTLAPEHELVTKITTPEQKEAVEAYIAETAKRSERDRMADVKTITGVFTGAYAEHPFTKEAVPIWIGDYVLAGYGTGAVMAVPCGDQRDHDFANHFAGAEGMPPIKNIFKDVDVTEAAHADKEGTVITNSDFLNDMPYQKALKTAIYELEKIGFGEGKVNYRLRDAVFSRQRYWGEPFPVYYVDGMPQMIDEKHLPLRLPEVEKYLPTEEGEPPLGRAEKWHWDTNTNEVVPLTPQGVTKNVYPLELNTMPGWAGSSWYFFRYMEKAQRDEVFASKEAMDYWQNVDLYIGGSEHATGHLLYSRFWVKFLYDRGLVPVNEPFKKLINQGMILGESAFTYRINQGYYDYNGNYTEELDKQFELIFSDVLIGRLVSYHLLDGKKLKDAISGESYSLLEIFDAKYFEDNFKGSGFDLDKITFTVTKLHVPVEFVDLKNQIQIDGFASWYQGELYSDSRFLNENDSYLVNREVEKMSKSKYNVVNPDDVCEEYGADTLRMYEMFLGPLEQAKPWNTAGITGVYNFLKKFWKLFHEVDKDGNIGEFKITNSPSVGGGKGEENLKEGLKILHKTIKKVQEDIENFSFNTSISAFMVAVNELSSMNCNSREILEPLCVLISPYAPHIAEELWSKLGHEKSISTAPFPIFEEKHLKETTKEYPISFNGKMRFTMTLPLDLSKEDIEKAVLENEKTQEYLAGRIPKKTIVVPGKIVNFVG